MLNLSKTSQIKQIMAKYGFRVSKALGQNFIIDPQVCPKIAELGGAAENVGALEIGPGIGVLTAELAKRCKKVVAVELDKRLLPILNETLSEFDNVEIVCGDVLEIDLHALLEKHFAGMDVVVCANLPYYITSPIVMALLEQKLPVKSITVMVQKEAAERICAPVPSRAMGAVTVAVRWYSEPCVLFEVEAAAFMPPPDVTSAVIRLDVRESPPVLVEDEAMFFKVVKAAFSQRRKTVLNCLASGFAMDKPKVNELLLKAKVTPNSRAEQLSMQDFAAISNLL